MPTPEQRNDDDGVVVVQAPGWTSKPLHFRQDACASSTPIEIDWISATQLQGRLDEVVGSPLTRWPPFFDVRLVDCETPPEEWFETSLVLPAGVQQDGRWTALVPVGCFDTTLQVTPLAPFSQRHLLFEPDATLDLGDISLSLGATLHVHSTFGASGMPAAGSVIELLPAPDPAGGDNDLPSTHLASCQVDTRGWCDLVVGSGESHSLLIRPPDSRFTSKLLAAQPLEEGQGLVLSAQLPASAKLAVVLDTETSTLKTLSRLGARWAATPRDISGWNDGESRYATFGSGGTGSWESLAPGHWQLELELSRNSLLYNVAKKDDLHLEEGEVRQLTWPLDLPRFHGVVRRSGQGVPSRLQLIPIPTVDTASTTTSMIQVETDEDGWFEVLLPHIGTYRVVASPPDDQSRRSLLERVDFLDSDQPVYLDLPEGTISGRVLDAFGQPVADALVTASSMTAEYRSTRSSATGQFELDALSSGVWMVAARLSDKGSSRQSSLHRTELSDDETVGPLDLVLETSRHIDVQVLDDGGKPIPGAQVLATPFTPSGDLMGDSRTFSTTAEGGFVLDLPPGTGGSVVLEIHAAGFPTLSVRRGLVDPLILELPSRGGRVHVYSWTGEPWTPSQRFGLVLISQTGAILDTTSVMAARPTSQVLQLSDLAPGVWKLVHVDSSPQSLERLFLDSDSFPALAVFEVVPGETTQIWPQPPPPIQ